MGLRRKSREAALQFLFQEDFASESGKLEDLENRFLKFCSLYSVEKKAKNYALDLLKTTFDNQEEIDNLISKAAMNWRLSRIAATDRNILRIAVCEMLKVDDIPDQVAINEAVEIAKRFASDESPAFINGVLDAVRQLLRETQDPDLLSI